MSTFKKIVLNRTLLFPEVGLVSTVDPMSSNSFSTPINLQFFYWYIGKHVLHMTMYCVDIITANKQCDSGMFMINIISRNPIGLYFYDLFTCICQKIRFEWMLSPKLLFLLDSSYQKKYTVSRSLIHFFMSTFHFQWWPSWIFRFPGIWINVITRIIVSLDLSYQKTYK